MTRMGIRKTLALAGLIALPQMLVAQYSISDGAWQITFDESAKTLTYAQDGTTLVKGAYVEIHDDSGNELLSKNYPNVALNSESISDDFGKGTKYTYTYSGISGADNIEHTIYVYSNLNYIIVEAALVATNGTARTNYIAPIVTTTSVTFLPSGGQNVIYDMPHDNDNWVGYSAQPWAIGVKISSCEVSAFYDVTSRNGLVIGSIEHDNWKSAVIATPSGTNRLRNLTVAAGVVSSRTNDVWDGRPSLSEHGYISGPEVSSPKYFLGYYSDWRDGLEDLGEATEILCPKLPWNNGTIFAWQSWGGMAQYVNYEGAVNVSDFFYEQLEPAGFHNENGVCYMVLDSYWDNLTETQLKNFAQHCKENGQHPGIYHTPFSYWGTEEQAEIYSPYDGSPYTWADISIRANGELRKISSIALDPTHPGTIEYNRQRFENFKNWGFEYVKLDFINNGTLEADSYYESSITTGMQAYTYGMDTIIAMADGLFIDLSIAPIFPAKGHARRISCDSWGALSFSMYTLNNIELGWWLDRVYQYNDPDHLVLSQSEDDGAARIRYTCGAMTGTVLLGDNFSLAGSYLGTQAERDLALKIATNSEINAVAYLGRSFRPVEGGLADASVTLYGQYSYGVDNEFVLDTDEALYYVVFNFSTSDEISTTADFDRIGLPADEVVNITELWTGDIVSVTDGSFTISVPPRDVRMYRLEKSGWSGGVTDALAGEKTDIGVTYNMGRLMVKSPYAISSVILYDMQGIKCKSVSFSCNNLCESFVFDCGKGLYLTQIVLVTGETVVSKVLVY